jgi:hypothetical protein
MNNFVLEKVGKKASVPSIASVGKQNPCKQQSFLLTLLLTLLTVLASEGRNSVRGERPANARFLTLLTLLTVFCLPAHGKKNDGFA